MKEKSQVEICENILSLLNEVTQIELDINFFRTKWTESNAGNDIKTDVKYHIKCAWKHGIHASPTVFIDGLEEPEISSQWSVDQWNTYLGKLQWSFIIEDYKRFLF